MGSLRICSRLHGWEMADLGSEPSLCHQDTETGVRKHCTLLWVPPALGTFSTLGSFSLVKSDCGFQLNLKLKGLCEVSSLRTWQVSRRTTHPHDFLLPPAVALCPWWPNQSCSEKRGQVKAQAWLEKLLESPEPPDGVSCGCGAQSCGFLLAMTSHTFPRFTSPN